MYIDKYKIMRDGETVAVYLVGENKKTKEETLKPVAYVRDFLGGLEAVQRKMSVEACEKSDLTAAVKLLKKQHAEIKALVKKGCKDCLDE